MHASTRRKVYSLSVRSSRIVSFSREEKANATNASHSMTSDYGSMPAQRMTSRLANSKQMSTKFIPETRCTRWRHRKFTDEFDTGSEPVIQQTQIKSTEDFPTFARNLNASWGKSEVCRISETRYYRSEDETDFYLEPMYLYLKDTHLGHSQSGCTRKNIAFASANLPITQRTSYVKHMRLGRR